MVPSSFRTSSRDTTVTGHLLKSQRTLEDCNTSGLFFGDEITSSIKKRDLQVQFDEKLKDTFPNDDIQSDKWLPNNSRVDTFIVDKLTGLIRTIIEYKRPQDGLAFTHPYWSSSTVVCLNGRSFSCGVAIRSGSFDELRYYLCNVTLSMLDYCDSCLLDVFGL